MTPTFGVGTVRAISVWPGETGLHQGRHPDSYCEVREEGVLVQGPQQFPILCLVPYVIVVLL